MLAPRYAATRQKKDGVEPIRLIDTNRNTAVSIVPSIGKIAYKMLAHGRNVLPFPFPSLTPP